MKKETIFKHELNESIQANAALNCIKNRNNHKQINEVAPVVAAAGRMLLPMLRPVITKLVQKALVKIGTHARPAEVLKLVMGMLTKGELAKKMAEKCGQTWNEIPSNVKKEIQNAIIDAFKAQSPQEQEEEDYTNDEIPSPNFSYRMSFMVWAMREIIPYLKEISQVCAQADPTSLKHAVMKILKTRDTGIPETPRSCQEWAKQNYDWVEMELNGEYDAYQKKWSKPFNIPASIEETPYIPSEQEETTDEKGAFALKLVKKFKNRMTPDYAKRPELFMMLKLQNALKKPLMSLSKEEYHAWAKAICDACESVFGSAQEQEEDGINKGGMHNLVQVGHIMNTPSLLDKLDTEYFSDLEEQEAYYANFRAIAKLVADQIDKENGKDIANNMDTLFEIVREVWNNNPDDLYIWDFDDVQENDCYKFFDKYYETIKNEYLKREHNNIMAATHDDLFASEQEELPQMERQDMILALSEYMSESWVDTGDDGDLDDIYYAVADILDKTGDYPASTSWEDCKPWCQKHYKEVEARIY